MSRLRWRSTTSAKSSPMSTSLEAIQRSSAGTPIRRPMSIKSGLSSAMTIGAPGFATRTISRSAFSGIVEVIEAAVAQDGVELPVAERQVLGFAEHKSNTYGAVNRRHGHDVLLKKLLWLRAGHSCAQPRGRENHKNLHTGWSIQRRHSDGTGIAGKSAGTGLMATHRCDREKSQGWATGLLRDAEAD